LRLAVDLVMLLLVVVVVGTLAPSQPAAMAVSACVFGLWSWLPSMLCLTRERGASGSHPDRRQQFLLFFKGWKPRVLKKNLKKKINYS
jgi:hypothetical protein